MRRIGLLRAEFRSTFERPVRSTSGGHSSEDLAKPGPMGRAINKTGTRRGSARFARVVPADIQRSDRWAATGDGAPEGRATSFQRLSVLPRARRMSRAASKSWFETRTGGIRMSLWDFVLASLIGLIDLNPFLDLILTPVAWVLVFLT